MKVTFKIESVNVSRAERTDEFIRVEVFEENESLGLFWQTPNLLNRNIKNLGIESYKNLEDFRKELKHFLVP